ncbi:hypothetical protein KKH82_08685 [Patescibacteria group bacterium]|nr:hypothetical protein [Patescibacteria group bacterium]
MKQNAIDLKEHFGLEGKVIFAKTLHFEFNYLVFLTNMNNLKKTKKELVLSFRKFPTKIMGLADGEKIVNVEAVNDGIHLGVITKQGWMNIFKSEDLRAM